MPRLQHVSSPFPPGQQSTVRSFYGGVLQLQEKKPPESLDPGLVWFGAGDGEQELHFFPGTPDPEHARHLCLEVEDLQACRSRLSEAGYEPYDTTPISHRPRFMCRDPFGNLLELTKIEGSYQQP